MLGIKIINFRGEATILGSNEADYQIVSVTGLNPPPATINTVAAAGIDGAAFNSSRIGMRNVVITLQINRSGGQTETIRQQLYRAFATKRDCRIYLSTENRSVYADGYVESVSVNLYEKGQRMQISILCPFPYFRSVTDSVDVLSTVDPLFFFPFAINEDEPIPFSERSDSPGAIVYNDSDAETGATIRIYFRDAVDGVTIANETTGEELVLEYPALAGDLVTVVTQRGSKSVTLLRDGVIAPLLSAVQPGSAFPQLEIGINDFAYAVSGGTEEDVAIEIQSQRLFRGI